MSLDEFVACVDEIQEEELEEARERYSEHALSHWQSPHNFRPPPPQSISGRLQGVCGDTMEIWLELGGSRIKRAGFLTDGCGSSIMCGSAAAWVAQGMSVREARGITQERILEELGGLPEVERHCALLAIIVLNEALDIAEAHD